MEKTLTNTTASQAKDNVKLLINYSIYFRVSLRVAYNGLQLGVRLRNEADAKVLLYAGTVD